MHPELFATEQRRVRIVPPHGKRPALLECDAMGSGRSATYCTGFVPGGTETFVAEIVGNVY